jgi:hypothetical protein
MTQGPAAEGKGRESGPHSGFPVSAAQQQPQTATTTSGSAPSPSPSLQPSAQPPPPPRASPLPPRCPSPASGLPAPLPPCSGVWDVVSLSAVAAMDHGRRRMYALSLGPPPHTPLHITASRSAVARFWVLLADFVALRCTPASWHDALPPGHPFICVDPASGTFVVNRPAADPPPPDEWPLWAPPCVFSPPLPLSACPHPLCVWIYVFSGPFPPCPALHCPAPLPPCQLLPC